MSDRLILAVPSKGRLMQDTLALFERAGLTIRKIGDERGYRGEIVELPGVDVSFVSASEIAQFLKTGRVHLGVTGEDLVREAMFKVAERVQFLLPLGFGKADVVVAVPDCWIDVRRIADIEEMAHTFRRVHGRRIRVATKFTNTTRRFFATRGVTSYRIIESLGATEGAIVAGTAEMIVDITSTGETLRANKLRILDDGLILPSQANLVASRTIDWRPAAREAENEVIRRLETVVPEAPAEEAGAD
ncbi:MAG: ATP phosphoribosyltransferase [Pseudomonadota bacterium]